RFNSNETIKHHLRNIYDTLGVKNRTEASTTVLKAEYDQKLAALTKVAAYFNAASILMQLRDHLAIAQGEKPKGVLVVLTNLEEETKTETAQKHTLEKLGLTKRERQMLGLIVIGMSNQEIARQEWITEGTVKFHLSNVY